MKKSICILSFYLVFFFTFNSVAALALSLQVGDDVTLTEMNWSSTWQEVPAPSNPGTLPPNIIEYQTIGNTAHTKVSTSAVDLECIDAQSGSAHAHIGIEFNLEAQEKTDTDSIANITINYSTNAESILHGGGTADAILDLVGIEENKFLNRALCTTHGQPTSCEKSFQDQAKSINSLKTIQPKETYQIGLACYAHADICDGSASAICDVTIHSIRIRITDKTAINSGEPDPLASENEPVNIVNGNMYIIKRDLSTPSPGISFDFTRAYNSIDEQNGPLGRGWTHNFNVTLSPPEDDASPAMIADTDGRLITFRQVNPGEFQPIVGEYSTLEKTGSGFIWTKKDKTKYTFDSEGLLLSIQDQNANTISLDYNSENLVSTITDTAGRQYQLSYDANNHLTGITGPADRTVTYQYDGNGNLLQVTDPEGVVTQYEYNDPNDPHNITKQAIGGEFVYTYTYDDQDRCIQASGPNGELGDSFEYHPEDGYTIITDAKGNTHTKHYNAYGKVTRVVYSDSSEENFAWGDNLNKIEEIKQDGSTRQYEYDGRGNLTKAVNPMGNERVMTYDDQDNLTSLTDDAGRTTTYSYDSNGNLTQIKHPDGNQTAYTYNTRGQVLSSTDPKGNTTTYSYDQEGNLISITDPEGNTVHYSYDSLGRKITQTDPRGNTTQYQYDAINRVTKVTDALGGEVDTTYKIGGVGSKEDQSNNTTTFQYDALNRLISVTDPLGHSKQLSYDDNGNQVSRTDYNGQTTTYSFNSLDRLVFTAYPDGSEVTYSYDEAGRLTQLTDSTGTSTYDYDTLGRLVSYTNGQGMSVSYTYDQVGNLKTITYPGSKVVTYTYDNRNRLINVQDWAGRQTDYTYDQSGLLTLATLPNGAKVEYEYDDADRVIGLRNLRADNSVIASYSYSLDQNGNIVSKTAQQALDPILEPESVNYVYGADNRLEQVNYTNLSYDQNGNLIAKGDKTYQYNYENLLERADSPEGTWEYTYDGQGNRVGLIKNGEHRRFLLDPRGIGRVLAEYDGNNNLLAYYIYGLGLICKVNALDQPYYYHYNLTGHTVAMTDSGGNIVNKYGYTPFGLLAASEESVPNPFRYVGKFGVMDDGNGLLYMRARYYDVEAGRFVTKDPIGFAGGVNLYVYVNNNSVNYIDSVGLCKNTPPWANLLGKGVHALGTGIQYGQWISMAGTFIGSALIWSGVGVPAGAAILSVSVPALVITTALNPDLGFPGAPGMSDVLHEWGLQIQTGDFGEPHGAIGGGIHIPFTNPLEQ